MVNDILRVKRKRIFFPKSLKSYMYTKPNVTFFCFEKIYFFVCILSFVLFVKSDITGQVMVIKI